MAALNLRHRHVACADLVSQICEQLNDFVLGSRLERHRENIHSLLEADVDEEEFGLENLDIFLTLR